MVFYNLADLGAGLKDLLRRVDILETNDGAGYTSVDEGSFRIRSEEGLIVEGSARVDGVLIGVDGSTLDWDGDVALKRKLDVTAQTKLRGLVELLADLVVKPGGKITVEGPSAATLQNGELSFASGGKVVAYPNGAAVAAGSAQVVASTAGAIMFFGTNNIGVTSSGTGIDGGLTVNGAVDFNSITVKPGSVANLHIDSAGKLWRTS